MSSARTRCGRLPFVRRWPVRPLTAAQPKGRRYRRVPGCCSLVGRPARSVRRAGAPLSCSSLGEVWRHCSVTCAGCLSRYHRCSHAQLLRRCSRRRHQCRRRRQGQRKGRLQRRRMRDAHAGNCDGWMRRSSARWRPRRPHNRVLFPRPRYPRARIGQRWLRRPRPLTRGSVAYDRVHAAS